MRTQRSACVMGLLLVMALPARGASSVSQYGITWTFEAPAEVGRFVTGDSWVKGPVTVASVSPAPTTKPGRHGSVVNPKAGDKQGYDDRTALGGKSYDPERVAVFPLALKPGDSLVSTISVAKVGQKTKDTVRGQYCRGPIQTAAVLTCVAEAPPADAFRPAYCSDWKKIFRVQDLKLERLPGVEPKGTLPDVAQLERYLERPWLDHRRGWVARMMHPMENMPDYGREITNITSTTALFLVTKDAAQKHPTLLQRYVQLGIDLFGITRSNPSIWNADGGHCSGRKMPILFAGVLLDDADMMKVKASFQEDQQTYFGKGYRGQTVLWRITLSQGRWHEHLPPAKWAGPPFKGANDGWKSEGYRSLNGPTWVDQALAARLMGIMDLWNHAPFFAYVDRWIAEAPNGRVDRKSMKPTGYKPFGNSFSEQMWGTYRKQADEIGKRTRAIWAVPSAPATPDP